MPLSERPPAPCWKFLGSSRIAPLLPSRKGTAVVGARNTLASHRPPSIRLFEPNGACTHSSFVECAAPVSAFACQRSHTAQTANTYTAHLKVRICNKGLLMSRRSGSVVLIALGGSIAFFVGCSDDAPAPDTAMQANASDSFGGDGSGGAPLASAGTPSENAGTGGLDGSQAGSAATAGDGGAGGSAGMDNSGGTGGMEQPAGDTWENYASGFMSQFCVSCHNDDNAGEASRDYHQLSNVMGESAEIACGLSKSEEDWSARGCTGFPPARQFPVGDGDKPSDEDRDRLIAWIDAGLP